MSSSQKAKIALTLALVLLCLSGIAAGMVVFRLYKVETLVHHTYDSEVAIGDFESSLTELGRTRVAFVNSATPESLKNFSEAVNKVSPALDRMRQLTSDNSAQQALCNQLESIGNQRVETSRRSVELKQQSPSDAEGQLQFTFEMARSAFETAAITQQMRRNEDTLLEQRSRLSDRLFTIIPGILTASFLFSAYMFWVNYRLVNRELQERKAAESQMRQLSLQLMRVQDEEHRRFARELHDGLGQILASAKMMADALPPGDASNRQIAELGSLLGEAVSQTRTISHLFHPPFLDEIGFASAAEWLIDGYAQRMGVVVTAKIPRPEKRLPHSLELTLFRVLQESLNNIVRHSKSARAEVSVQTDADWVTLRVRDYGQGITDETLATLQTNRERVGIGLTGMKERVKEQSGVLEIRSEATGTEIIVKIPISTHMGSQDSTPAEKAV